MASTSVGGSNGPGSDPSPGPASASASASTGPTPAPASASASTSDSTLAAAEAQAAAADLDMDDDPYPPNQNCLFEKFVVPKIVLYQYARENDDSQLRKELAGSPIAGLPIIPRTPPSPPREPPQWAMNVIREASRLLGDPEGEILDIYDSDDEDLESEAPPPGKCVLVTLPPDILDRIYVLLGAQDMLRIAVTARYPLYVFYRLQRRSSTAHNCDHFRRPAIPGGYRCEKRGLETAMLVRQMGSGFFDRDGKETMRFCGSCMKWVPMDCKWWLTKVSEGIVDNLPYSVQPVRKFDSEGREIPVPNEVLVSNFERGRRSFLHDDVIYKRRVGEQSAEVWCKLREPRGWLEKYRARCCPRCACKEENFRMRTRRDIRLKAIRDRWEINNFITPRHFGS